MMLGMVSSNFEPFWALTTRGRASAVTKRIDFFMVIRSDKWKRLAGELKVNL